MIDVLHVTEAYGGGVTSAINTYVEHSNQYRHHLIAFLRESDRTGEEGGSEFTSVQFYKRNFAEVLKIKRRIAELDPDVIHIHSTYAGFFFRILPFIDSRKVVYTPHGFAFLRNDGEFKTSLYRMAERVLCMRTKVLAGCSRSEVIDAARIGYRKCHELVNICGPLPRTEGGVEAVNDRPTIGMVGRICEQKGYRYFAQVAEQLRERASFKWIGGGDDSLVSFLESCGVEVTGWLSRSEVLTRLYGLDLYFHTAAWEGFPISVLEAAELSKPVILRDIVSFTAENLPVVGGPESAVAEISAWLDLDLEVLDRAKRASQAINVYHSPENLRKSLSSLYGKFA